MCCVFNRKSYSGVDSRVVEESVVPPWTAPTASKLSCAPERDRLVLVPRKPSTFWTVVLLLVARLVLGEFAYALPHYSENKARVVESVPTGECPDHTDSKQDEQHPADSKSDSQPANESTSAHHQVECCKTTCDCACVQISPVAAVLPNATPALLSSTDFVGPSVRPFGPVLSGIFRPPA